MEFPKEITKKQALERKSFWNTYFFAQFEVSWDEFILAFRHYIQIYGDHELDDHAIGNIRKLIDPNYESTVSSTDFDIFYQKFWKDIHTLRKIMKYSVPPQVKLESDKHKFQATIKVIRVPKPNLSSFAQQTSVELQHLKFDEFPNWQPFKVGNAEDCQLILERENIIYNDVTFKLFPFHGGFKARCMSKLSRTKLRVEKKPYLLTPGMVIEFGKGVLMRVVSSFPQSRADFESYIPTSTYFRLQADNERYVRHYALKSFDSVAQYRETQQEINKLDLLFTKNVIPKIVLEGISKSIKGETYTLKVDFKKDEFQIGRAPKINEISIGDITVSNSHCIIGYDMSVNHFGWYIKEEEPTVFGTHILLANYDQYEKRLPSNSHQLVDDMLLCLDDFQFRFIEDVYQKDPDAENGYKLLSIRDPSKFASKSSE